MKVVVAAELEVVTYVHSVKLMSVVEVTALSVVETAHEDAVKISAVATSLVLP